MTTLICNINFLPSLSKVLVGTTLVAANSIHESSPASSPLLQTWVPEDTPVCCKRNAKVKKLKTYKAKLLPLDVI